MKRLQKKSTTTEEARLDIKANGLRESRFTKIFFDVKVFNPLAKSCQKNIEDAYKYHETIKKQKYEKRIIDVEKATLAPLVFSSSGGAGPSAAKVMKRIATKLSEKIDNSYSDIITYIRTKLSSPSYVAQSCAYADHVHYEKSTAWKPRNNG